MAGIVEKDKSELNDELDREEDEEAEEARSFPCHEALRPQEAACAVAAPIRVAHVVVVATWVRVEWTDLRYVLAYLARLIVVVQVG